MDLKYLFEKTLLPEWAIGIFAVWVLTINGSLSPIEGGPTLTLIGLLVFLFYKSEGPSLRWGAIGIMAFGAVTTLLGFL